MSAHLDRRRLRMYPLAARKHKLAIEQIAVSPDSPAPDLPAATAGQVGLLADAICAARSAGRPVILTYGAHLVKNGLAPVVIRLIEAGWVTHVATNGAGSIHDWEFAWLGQSTEDVRENTAHGCFGTWDETGRMIGLAVAIGGLDDLGYGASVGRMISDGALGSPSAAELRVRLQQASHRDVPDETIGAVADMLHLCRSFDLPAGRLHLPHRWKRYSVQRAAWEAGVPFTVHPGIGYDIIYTHPMTSGGAIGRGALRDFLLYAEGVSRLAGGVHIAVGSAIMAPMIFEKALSMANNLHLTEGREVVSGHTLAVVDIQDGGDWDWRTGEPPMEHPAYYLRFCKTFFRMGGSLDYLCMDNRDFMLALWREVEGRGPARSPGG